MYFASVEPLLFFPYTRPIWPPPPISNHRVPSTARQNMKPFLCCIVICVMLNPRPGSVSSHWSNKCDFR